MSPRAVMSASAPPPWEDILRARFVFEENCWRSCGGYCCDIRHDGFTFNLLPAEGTSLLHLGDEYDWMAANGHIPADAIPREIVFDFGGPAPLRLMAVDCKLKGVCDGSRTRPLHCRLYPFLPVFGVDGELTDVTPASIFDLTRLTREGKTSCNLWNEKRDAYFTAWKQSDTLDVLRHPLLMFYFAVYKSFADDYVKNLQGNAMLATLQGADFWRRWELLYLGRRLFNPPVMKELALDLHETFSRAHGDFLPRGA